MIKETKRCYVASIIPYSLFCVCVVDGWGVGFPVYEGPCGLIMTTVPRISGGARSTEAPVQ